MMESLVNQELESPVYYIAPDIFVSFRYISNYHVRYLSGLMNVVEMKETDLDRSFIINRGSTVILHPLLYMLMGDKDWMCTFRIRRLHRLRDHDAKVMGFDVADSDKLSGKAVDVVNRVDCVCVPTTYSKEVYERSGVKTRVEVVWHGLDELYYSKPKEVSSPNLKGLKEYKEKHNCVYVLFNIQHSGFRKGADLVYEVMKRVQNDYDNVVLVAKRAGIRDPYLQKLAELKTIEFAAVLNIAEMIELYDLCDILVVPSRGGGFELVGLEGIARGLPTLVTNAGCFLDYVKYCVPIRVARQVKVLEGNPVHIGNGFEADINCFYSRLCDVIDNLDEYRARTESYKEELRQKYTWSRVADRIYEVISSL